MAFMVPLVKNHYEIYNTKSAISDHPDVAFYHSASSVGSTRRKIPNAVATSGSKNTNKNGTVVLNGIVLMNGRSKSKPKVILASQARNAGKLGKQQGQTNQQSVPRSLPINTNSSSKKQQQSNQQAQSPTHMSSSTRSFPHVKRTVRNPVTNRVYSYSVSIPEYVAEEDEEELAALEMESELESPSSESLDDQVMIFSTSAPAGTGSIDNGIIDIVDEDDFIRCTGARLPPTIRSQSKQISSKKSSPNKIIKSSKKSTKMSNGEDDLSIQNRTTLSLSKSLPNTSTSGNADSSLDDSVDDQSDCASSNSREYMELLQKFILHLKMLKLKRLFNSNKTKKQKQQQRKQQESSTSQLSPSTIDDCQQPARSRSSTLDDSINL